MSTIIIPAPATTPARPPYPDIPAEQRIAIRDIPWDLYDRLSDAIGEGQNVHLAYQVLQVGEVWRFDGDTVVIEQLGPDGVYISVASSRFLPIRVEEVVRWVVEEDTDDLPARRERLRAWILAELCRA